MKRLIYLASVSAVVALTALTGHAKNDPRAIVPGHAVGQVIIGKPSPSSLGKPINGDGAMGRYDNTYASKNSPYRLDILEHRVSTETDRIVVETIRVESPYFRTEEGVTPKSSLAAIRREFPAVKPQERWKHTANGKTRHYTIYDDRQQGIAFEVDNRTKKATAIYVHPAGDDWIVNGHYEGEWQRVEDSSH